MKKTFTLFALIFTGLSNVQSQSLEAWTVDAAGTTTLVALTNGTTVAYSTTGGGQLTTKIKFKNISSVTHTYNVIRTDVKLHRKTPTDTAAAYFCFGDMGSCYTAAVYEPTGDFVTLAAGAETSGINTMVTDLQEASVVGYSEVRYKLFDLTTGKNGADTLSWTFKFNQLLSVNENENVLENVSNIYPNPSANNANVTVVLANEVPVKVQVFNSLGSVVYTGAEQQLSGKNKLAIDCTNLNTGLYFVTITAGNSKITKRLVVNK